MEFYFLTWVQLLYDFRKVVSNGTTQGKVCHTRSGEKICSNSGCAKKEMKFCFMSFNPPLMLMYFLYKFVFESHPCMTKLKVRVLSYLYFMDNYELF
jgi:hypothetical protein